jgi:hypothetical protein
MKSILIYDKFWTINYVKNNPDKLFIFGDNDIQLFNNDTIYISII